MKLVSVAKQFLLHSHILGVTFFCIWFSTCYSFASSVEVKKDLHRCVSSLASSLSRSLAINAILYKLAGRYIDRDASLLRPSSRRGGGGLLERHCSLRRYLPSDSDYFRVNIVNNARTMNVVASFSVVAYSWTRWGRIDWSSVRRLFYLFKDSGVVMAKLKIKYSSDFPPRNPARKLHGVLSSLLLTNLSRSCSSRNCLFVSSRFCFESVSKLKLGGVNQNPNEVSHFILNEALFNIT